MQSVEMNKACRSVVEAWHSCRRRGRGCKISARPVTLAAVVRTYCQDFQCGANAEQDYYANLPTLSEAVERAARAERPDGKRHDHQTRLSKNSLETARRQLTGAPILSCTTFAELHSLIERAILPVPGIGELMVYDTALRIGARMGLEPELVYLHRGTRAGAKAMGLDVSRGWVSLSELPDELRKLAPREIEDCLCIYKNELRKIYA